MLGSRLLIIALVAAAFASNKNSRAHVREFISSFDDWGMSNNCVVLILVHPPKANSRYAGSTDWRGAARSLFTLERVKEESAG